VAFVLDASVAIAWFVKSLATEYTNALLRRAAAERLHVLALWHAEFANVLLALAHRRKLDPARLEAIFAAIDALDWKTDAAPPGARELAALARRFSLSAYDATYLELALRLALPIAARDGPLCKAAPRAGVAIA
jgi:predicted nucleic acid-binding protein